MIKESVWELEDFYLMIYYFGMKAWSNLDIIFYQKDSENQRSEQSQEYPITTKLLYTLPRKNFTELTLCKNQQLTSQKRVSEIHFSGRSRYLVGPVSSSYAPVVI